MYHDIYVFILAAFLGLEVIKRVSPLLHTPLMSLTNAISAISVMAAIEMAGKQETVLVDDPGHDWPWPRRSPTWSAGS